MTQPLTLQASKVAAETAAALELVDVVKVDENQMEAHHRETGHVLGTARRDAFGWLILVAPYTHEVVIAPAAAELVLLYLAGARAAVLAGVR